MEAVDLDLKGNDGREIFGPSRASLPTVDRVRSK